MFQFLYIFGPAAITYFVVRKCIRKAPANWYEAFFELLAYAMLNAVILTLFLLPFGKVEIILMANGVKTLQYGGTAFLLTFPIAVISGVVISIIRKGIDFKIKAVPEKTQKKKETENEMEK